MVALLLTITLIVFVAIELFVARRAEQTVTGELLLALAAGEFPDAELRRQARDFMRRILQHYLGPKPLKSRELFAQPGKTSDITK